MNKILIERTAGIYIAQIKGNHFIKLRDVAEFLGVQQAFQFNKQVKDYLGAGNLLKGNQTEKFRLKGLDSSRTLYINTKHILGFLLAEMPGMTQTVIPGKRSELIHELNSLHNTNAHNLSKTYSIETLTTPQGNAYFRTKEIAAFIGFKQPFALNDAFKNFGGRGCLRKGREAETLIRPGIDCHKTVFVNAYSLYKFIKGGDIYKMNQKPLPGMIDEIYMELKALFDAYESQYSAIV